jgi:solute carrier family 13 (sodium-dependent dicarboxylate transporter), member 2/3/5
MPLNASITLALLSIIVVLLITKRFSLTFIGVLIPIILYLSGVIDNKAAFSNLTHPILIMLICIFIQSKAIFEVGLAYQIGESFSAFTRRIGQDNERITVMLVIGFGALMSTVLPNIATTAALVPIVIAVSSYSGISRSKLLITLALGTSMGGSITLIGTPPNFLAKATLDAAGIHSLGFFDFAWIGIPLTLLGMLYLLTIGFKSLPNHYVEAKQGALEEEQENSENDNKATKAKQWIVALLFSAFILSIIFEKTTGIPSQYIGIIGVMILGGMRILNERQIFSAVDWSTTIFISGILTLAVALSSTGANEIVAGLAIKLIGNTSSPYVFTGLLFVISAILTQFLSNTGTAGVLMPIGLSIAQSMNADPRAVIMAIALGCAASFATPIATPSNTIVTGPGQLTFMDWVKVGSPLVIIGLVLSLLILPLVFPFF